MVKLKSFFLVIMNGEEQKFTWPDIPLKEFAEANAKVHQFGDIARKAGEAPIKAVFTFKNGGNIQGIRGDSFTGKPVEMIKKLHRLAHRYWTEKKIHDVKIYDNRHLLPAPFDKGLILHWNEEKQVVINLLPFYSGVFDIKRVAYK